MTKETEHLISRIPADILNNIRTDDPRVLRKIVKSLERRDELRKNRADREKTVNPHDTLVRLFKDRIKNGSIEIRTDGGTQSVANELLRSRTGVCIVCPDFETESSSGNIIYKAGGSINGGLGMTGHKLISSVGFIEDIGKIIGGLDLFVIYHASAEENITRDDKEKILSSSNAMRSVLTENEHGFSTHFMVLSSDSLIRKSRELAGSLTLTDSEVEKLCYDREEIIRMRLGIVNKRPLPSEIKKQEAAFDIAVHLESESSVREMIGRDNFVHFAVDSARFSGYYQNPAIAIGRDLHYKGD